MSTCHDERSLDRTLERSRERSHEWSRERSLENSRERSHERSLERSSECSCERFRERSRERSRKRSRERPRERLLNVFLNASWTFSWTVAVVVDPLPHDSVMQHSHVISDCCCIISFCFLSLVFWSYSVSLLQMSVKNKHKYFLLHRNTVIWKLRKGALSPDKWWLSRTWSFKQLLWVFS